jgi:hypothetical protein
MAAKIRTLNQALTDIDRLRADADAFRVAVIESGALNSVSQSKYFAQLRTLETTLVETQ